MNRGKGEHAASPLTASRDRPKASHARTPHTVLDEASASPRSLRRPTHLACGHAPPRSQASGHQNLIAPSMTTSSKVRSDTLRVSLAPGPPASALTVNGTLFPAPKPVTVAIPVNIARGPLISAETILPVTYMTLVSNFPLPGWPAGSLGTSAKHSNLLSASRQ